MIPIVLHAEGSSHSCGLQSGTSQYYDHNTITCGTCPNGSTIKMSGGGHLDDCRCDLGYEMKNNECQPCGTLPPNARWLDLYEPPCQWECDSDYKRESDLCVPIDATDATYSTNFSIEELGIDIKDMAGNTAQEEGVMESSQGRPPRTKYCFSTGIDYPKFPKMSDDQKEKFDYSTNEEHILIGNLECTEDIENVSDRWVKMSSDGSLAKNPWLYPFHGISTRDVWHETSGWPLISTYIDSEGTRRLIPHKEETKDAPFFKKKIEEERRRKNIQFWNQFQCPPGKNLVTNTHVWGAQFIQYALTYTDQAVVDEWLASVIGPDDYAPEKTKYDEYDADSIAALCVDPGTICRHGPYAYQSPEVNTRHYDDCPDNQTCQCYYSVNKSVDGDDSSCKSAFASPDFPGVTFEGNVNRCVDKIDESADTWEDIFTILCKQEWDPPAWCGFPW